MYFIYILFSQKTNRYYIGSMDDLARRLNHHHTGSTPSTKPEAPDWEIRYTETVPDRVAALKREREIKKKKSRNYLEWLIQNVWGDLVIEKSIQNQVLKLIAKNK